MLNSLKATGKGELIFILSYLTFRRVGIRSKDTMEDLKIKMFHFV